MNLLENAHYRVDVVPGSRIVRVVRSAVPFVTRADVDASCGALMSALDRFGRSTSCLLLDVRAAAGRNDADFERWFASYRRDTLVGFVRAAVLVSTAVGKLQSERVLREDRQPATICVFADETIALAWLREVFS